MFVNLQQIPPGKSMYTLYVTEDPEGTPRSEMCCEEVDTVFKTGAAWGTIATYAGARPDWPYSLDARIIGVVNQSEGYVVFDAFLEGVETGANNL